MKYIPVEKCEGCRHAYATMDLCYCSATDWHAATTWDELFADCPLPDLPDVAELVEALKKICDLEKHKNAFFSRPPEYGLVTPIEEAITIARAALAKAEVK